MQPLANAVLVSNSLQCTLLTDDEPWGSIWSVRHTGTAILQLDCILHLSTMSNGLPSYILCKIVWM